MEPTLEEHIDIAARVARTWTGGFSLDADERHAVAMEAGWEAQCSELPEGFCYRSWTSMITKRRLVDEIRRKYGRAYEGVNPERTLPLEMAGDEILVYDPDDVVFREMISNWARGDERIEYVLERIAAGDKKQDIAEALGVHPSRVSQFLSRIRKRETCPS